MNGSRTVSLPLGMMRVAGPTGSGLCRVHNFGELSCTVIVKPLLINRKSLTSHAREMSSLNLLYTESTTNQTVDLLHNLPVSCIYRVSHLPKLRLRSRTGTNQKIQCRSMPNAFTI